MSGAGGWERLRLYSGTEVNPVMSLNVEVDEVKSVLLADGWMK